MSRKKIFAISATVIILLVIAFFVGIVYTPYQTVTRYDEYIEGGFERPGIEEVTKY